MIITINNLPQTLLDRLEQTDERFKSLIIQLEHARVTDNEDKKDLVLHTIHSEYGREFTYE